MALDLHVWGPAFRLPSIDAECLAAISYFALAVPGSDWRLIQSSNPLGDSSHTLPALHHAGSWICGYRAIVSYLRTLSSSYDLDAACTAAQRADTTAYSSFVAAHAAPLLALSLYVSSANWAARTRPAYSSILPFPLTWTEPLKIRAAAARLADHLGLSALDTDSRPEDESSSSATPTHSFLQVPESLRLARPSVAGSLSPEQTARIRLDAVTRDCLGVLAELKGEKKYLLGGFRPTSLDCLVFGYLLLMVQPDLPRPWLKEMMQEEYPGLLRFTVEMHEASSHFTMGHGRPQKAGTRATAFVDLPTADDETAQSSRSFFAVSARFVRDLVESIPVLGETWKQRAVLGTASRRRWAAIDVALAMFTTAAGVALVGGFVFYRQMGPFGAAVQRWERKKKGLAAFGAVGAMLGITSP